MKLKLLLFFIGIQGLIFGNGISQENKWQSKIPISKEVKKIKLQLQLTDTYLQRHNIDSAFIFVKQAIINAENINDPFWLAKSYYKYGDVCYYNNQYNLSNNAYQKAKGYALKAKDTILFVDLLIDQGYIYDYWQKKDSTLLLMNKAIELANKVRYIKGIARASMFMGNIYHSLNNYDKALGYYQKTLKNAQQIKNNKGVGIALGNIGMCYLELHQDSLAVVNLKKSIAILEKIQGSIVQVANSYNDLAIIYSRQGKVQMTKKNLEKAQNIFKKYGNQEDRAVGYNVVSECYTNLKKYRLSNQYLDSCIAIAKKTGFGLMLQKSYKSYAKNLQALHQYNSAYKYLEKHNQIVDSLQSQKFHKQFAELDVKYKTLENEHRIEQLEHKRKLYKVQFRNLLISSLSIILLLLISGYAVAQKRKKQNKIAALELEKSQILAQGLSEQIELKNKQLTTHALNMMQKNTLISALVNRISEIINLIEGEGKAKLKGLKRELSHLLTSEKDWDTFKIYFEQVNSDFLSNLKSVNANLTNHDMRLATLIRLKMTNKEIASIMNITHQSVKNAQYRLKNKLKLSKDFDLRDFIAGL